ncbi:MAG TPA: hypothetical protein VNU21_21370 [Usitatibacter sp.]|nr:hypothetical protein [Usitatibacter sp.]
MNRMWSARLPHVVPILATLLASCASSPVVIFEGEEELPVVAQTWRVNPADAAVPGRFVFPNAEPVEGVQCTMTNDKGTWSATTPGKVTVLVSAAPLRVDCTREGYKPARFDLQCRSPAQAAAQRQNIDVAMMIVTLPVAIVAAPLLPLAAAKAGTQAVMSGVSAVAEHGEAHKATDMCRYGFVAPTLKPIETD